MHNDKTKFGDAMLMIKSVLFIPHIQLILMSFMHYFTLLIDIWFEESRNINSIKMHFLFFLGI